MPDITQNCQLSKTPFIIPEKDLEFYKKMNVPNPTLCPDERQRRRLSWRNEINLYKRKCDLTGKDIISIYSQDKPYKVYDHKEWFSDKWNALQYGRDFDFSRPFFNQFEELFLEVPKMSMIIIGNNENSEFTHDVYNLKNCYLIFDGEGSIDSLYGETFDNLRTCIDFFYLKESELCYECINCVKCYNLCFSRFCNNCSDSAFLIDCVGCRNCFGCSNLRQKQYYIANKKHTKEEYEEYRKKIDFKSYAITQKYVEQGNKFFETVSKRSMRGLQNENVTGDNVDNSKDSFECFDCNGVRDCKYCTNVMMGATDCEDVDVWGDHLRMAYDCEGVGAESENLIACYYVFSGSSDISHSAFCLKNCHNIFGSTGLTQKRYCILNKQYTEEKYKDLLPKIIEHMKKTGEYGEFFPTKMSCFGYNETVANDYFPMTKEEAISRGYKWKDPDPKEYLPATYTLPDHLDEVPDTILKEILACANCGKNYKITDQELRFYRRQGFPIPRKCFECRHHDRMRLRNPRHLWDRQCAKCGATIKTTYSPNRPEKVYCEPCYAKEIQ